MNDPFVPDVQATTEDTNKTVSVPGLLAGNFATDAWEWYDCLRYTPWLPVHRWGRDGWSTGDSPSSFLVTAMHRDDNDFYLYGYGLFIEEEIETHWFHSRRACCEAITESIFDFWKLGIVDGPDPADLPETAAELHESNRRPSVGWFPERVNIEIPGRPSVDN